MDTISDEKYREAARRLYGRKSLNTQATVSVVAPVAPVIGEGAYVEMQVWVPIEDARAIPDEQLS